MSTLRNSIANMRRKKPKTTVCVASCKSTEGSWSGLPKGSSDRISMGGIKLGNQESGMTQKDQISNQGQRNKGEFVWGA